MFIIVFFVFLFFVFFFFFFFKQKTAYEIYQCDWSSDVCSSDLRATKPNSWLLHNMKSSASWLR